MSFIEPKEQMEIIKRGASDLINDEELLTRLQYGRKKGVPLRVKAGFDPTAPDIHLGHTVLIQKLKDFQDLGHQIVLLIGDFTGMIGDPTGRSEVRKPLTREEVKVNAETYTQQVFKILDPDKTEVVYNSEWMEKLSASDLIEISAKHTVARMLERDDFSKRYKGGKPISIHEFLYPLVQGYDSVVLKSDIELGGTDQLFNLLVGRELQREYGQPPQAVLTMPLLEGTDGVKKMSKSFGNYIGISEPPSEIFGKVMSISDELMGRYYELLTRIPISDLEEIRSGKRHPLEAKKALARMLTARFYSEGEALEAQSSFENLFKKKELPEDIEEDIVDPKVVSPQSEPGDVITSVRLANVVTAAGMTTTNSEAARLIRGGGLKVDEVKVEDTKAELDTGGRYLIQAGKRKFKYVSFSS